MTTRFKVGDRVETVAGMTAGDGSGGEKATITYVNKRAGPGQPQRWALRLRWDDGREGWVWPSDVEKL